MTSGTLPVTHGPADFMPGQQKCDKIPKLVLTYFKVRWLSYDPTTLCPSQHLKYDLRQDW